MPTTWNVLTAIAIAALIGGSLTAYLWQVRRSQLKVAGGLAALAAMRWREFAHFVIEALQAQGFEAAQEAVLPERGQHPDLTLTRDDQTWLLSCKQGANYRISPEQVAELATAVRFEGAAGGILATLGRFQPEARKHDHGVELIDGPTLWPLIEPLLPPSLHEDLEQRAHADTIRHTVAAWIIALAVGATAATLMATGTDEPTAAPDRPTPPVTQPAPAAAPPTAAPVASAPLGAGADPASPAALLSEPEQRSAITRDVSSLPGIEQALWSTRSTLLIELQQDPGAELIEDICMTIGRYPELSASRLQLQPPSGSTAAVRFMQCRPF
ncbi:restriction endonuclease [Lysobacter sp. D1-1-M9]|uniref:restriction endonuclease n=1 Tax=Novilysobacter longmucuonensis TaxID=3098603 RepID=UPI0039830DC9